MKQQIHSPDKISFILSLVYVGDAQQNKEKVASNERKRRKAILYLHMQSVVVHPSISRPQYVLRNACQALALTNSTYQKHHLLPGTCAA